MKIGPKYKIARRLGAPIFEKTQTQKFKMRSGEGEKGGGRGAKSDYGRQMIEKQKTKFTYGVSERQFSNYVKKVIENKSNTPSKDIFEALESRLDNIVARSGLASTRRFARQMVSHGHILLNGRKNNVPSAHVKVGDQISIREGSLKATMFLGIDEKIKSASVPVWMTWKGEGKGAVLSILRAPSMEGQDLLFDLGAVLEFYKR